KAGVNKNRIKLGAVSNDDRADWRAAWALFPGSVAYVWCASTHNDAVIASLEACGFERRSHIIWCKDRFALGRGHYHWQHEPCWYAVRGDAHWRGDRSQSMSCPRFFWTPICPTGGRNGEVQHEQDHAK